MKRALIGMVAASALMLVGNVQANEELAKSSGCMNCHNVDAKLVGPALKEVAAKYAGEDGAAEMLAGKIKNGSSGVWGQIPMPPNPAVSDENAQKLAEWVLSLK